MEHLNSLHGALAAIKHTTPLYMNISAHGVGWGWQVYDSALHLGHHVYAVSYPLGANATVLQTLEGEMVRSTSRCRVDLNGSSLHCITDQDCLVDISCENTSLQAKVAGVAMVDALLN